MATNSAAVIREGDMIAGKYRIERVLGRGAMGVVTAAMHVDLHERRAIKFMLSDCADDPEAVERFMREARACARLKSRHVATVYDVGRLENGAPYIVMEYLEGTDLKALLHERKILPIHEAVDYALQACEAIGEAHQAGVVHRDIKPANLFLAAGVGGAPHVKVLDFGIAKLMSRPGSEAAQHEMTGTSVVMGSPLYMSPEQMRSSRHVDARADIWSLGVVLYVMVTGSLPFYAETTIELISMILMNPPRRPSEVNPAVPPEFEAIILRCLEKDLANRWPQVADLANALRPFAVPQPEPSCPARAIEGAAPMWRASLPSLPFSSGQVPSSAPSMPSSSPSSSIAPHLAGSSGSPSRPSPVEPTPASASSVHAQSASYLAANMSSNAESSSQRLSEGLGSQTGGSWSQANHAAKPLAGGFRSLALGAAVGGALFFAGMTAFLLFRGGSSVNAPAASPIVSEGRSEATPAPSPSPPPLSPPSPSPSPQQDQIQAPEILLVPTQSVATPVRKVPASAPPAKETLPAQSASAAAPKSSPPAAPSKSKQDDSENPFGRTRH